MTHERAWHARHRPGRVQDLLPIADIDGAVVWLRGGGGRAVLAVRPRNFALSTEAEQEAIVAGYRALLAGLRFPLQVLVRVEPAPIERYLAGLGPRPGLSPALARLALDHEAFVRRLARERTLLDRRCFVVIPAGDDRRDRRPPPLGRWFRRQSRGGKTPALGQQMALTVQELAARCQQVSQALAGIGLHVRRLDEPELAALWVAMLAPDRARRRSRPWWGPVSSGPVAIIRRPDREEAPDAG